MDMPHASKRFYGREIMDLPMELIVAILNYLNTSDRAAIRSTCRRMYEASCHIEFCKAEKLTFFRTRLLQDNESPLKDLLYTSRSFLNIYFEQIEFTNKMTKFWDVFGPEIRVLSLKECDIREKTFVDILKKCFSLQELHVISCRELLMSGRLLQQNDVEFLKEQFGNLTTLNLATNRYLSDALFNRLVAIAPNLTSLIVSDCQISFHKAYYKKFYPGNDLNLAPSESILTFRYILEFIKSRSTHIKHLNFGSTLIDGSALALLAETEGLELDSLKLESCDQLTNPGILSLVQNQPMLTELNLSFSTRLTDQSLIAICKSLLHLKKLRLQRCRAITDLGVVDLKNLKCLELLDISECCPFITSEGVTNGVCAVVNPKLRQLNVAALSIIEIQVMLISETMPNLTVLDLSFCRYAVTDRTIQTIFERLIWLRILRLDHCDQFSDGGLTGMGLGTYGKNPAVKTKEVTREMTIEPTSSPFRISLRTKVEEEIVKDAKRKKVVLQLCEENSTSEQSSSGFSIKTLNGLQELNLSGCKVTDVSLKYSFVFPELRKLYLRNCQQISLQGLQYMVGGCPAIEYLNLGECHNVTDAAVVGICQGLPRLKELYLNSCTKLTNHALDAINMYCHNLKVLDISGCRSVDPEFGLKLNLSDPYRTVYMSKPGPYIQGSSSTPAPPPLPTRF